MLELHTTKKVGPDVPENRQRVGCYKNRKAVIDGMETCLESIGIVRALIEGLEAEGFIDDRVVLDRCAINLHVVGNQIGMLDPQLQFNDAMRTAYDVRSVIAHQYGTGSFSKSTFWRNINDDLDYLEQGCRQVIRTIASEEVRFISPNRKPRRPRAFVIRNR